MSAGKKLLKLFGLDDEYADIADRVAKALGPDPSPTVARAALRREGVPISQNPAAQALRAAATPPKKKAPARSERPLAVRTPVAPAIVRGRSGSPAATAQDVLREAQKPSKGALSYADWRAQNPGMGVLFDPSNLSDVPDVPQVQMERVVPPRGPSPRGRCAPRW